MSFVNSSCDISQQFPNFWPKLYFKIHLRWDLMSTAPEQFAVHNNWQWQIVNTGESN